MSNLLFARPPLAVPPPDSPPVPAPRRTFGPADDGAKVDFEEWMNGDFEPGFLAELARGVVKMVMVPNPPHEDILHRLRQLLYRWDDAHPGVIHTISGGTGSRVPVPPFGSDRHPDLTVYTTPFAARDSSAWRRTVPAVVCEVFSPGTRAEDEGPKAEEYLLFGCREYWLLNPETRTLRVLARDGGQWVERPNAGNGVGGSVVLPGLTLDPAALFDEAAFDAETLPDENDA